ncbi:hypothetical protein ACEQ8H_002732 [Pleosporales sp. CAS-2024a]
MDRDNPRPTKKRHLAADERQRAVRACRECRRLKEKCEGGMPCKRCCHLQRSCDFNVPSTLQEQRREIQAHRSVEELKRRTAYMESILRHHFPDLPLDTEALRHAAETLSLRKDGLYHQDETGVGASQVVPSASVSDSPNIEDENCTLDYVDGTTAHYSGEFSHWNFSMHIKRNIENLIAKSPETNFSSAKHAPEFIRVGEPDPNSTSIVEILALLPPRPLSAFLVDVFFKHATSYYYYVDKRWVYELLDELHTNPSRLTSKDVTPACLVLMVLAVATQYVHLDSPKQHGIREIRSSERPDAPMNWESDVGSTFYRQVARSLSDFIHAGTMFSVQVFLLLGLYSLPIDASGLGYIYLNLAIKLAVQNGMHRKASRGVFDAKTKEIRRCIWWTAYCMERKIGIYHGRPASILRSDVDADLPGNSAASELSSFDFDTTGLLESIQLTWQAEAFLHQIHTAAAGDISARGLVPPHEQWDFLIHDSISAAEEVIDICHDMRTNGEGLARSSYAEYSSCRASLLALIAHSVCCRTNEHSITLRKGLDAIREMASVGESAQSEVSLLESLDEALHRVYAFDGDHDSSTIEDDLNQSGYEGLLKWYRSIASTGSTVTSSSRDGSNEFQGVRVPDAGFAQHGPRRDHPCAINMASEITDDYPFDLDLLNTNRSTALFTPSFTQFGNVENELFENLLWPSG